MILDSENIWIGKKDLNLFEKILMLLLSTMWMEKLDIYVTCFHITTEKSALLFPCEIQVREIYLSYFPCSVDLTHYNQKSALLFSCENSDEY